MNMADGTAADMSELGVARHQLNEAYARCTALSLELGRTEGALSEVERQLRIAINRESVTAASRDRAEKRLGDFSDFLDSLSVCRSLEEVRQRIAELQGDDCGPDTLAEAGVES